MKNLLFIVATMMVALVSVGCKEHNKDNDHKLLAEAFREDTICSCPCATIILEPYGTFILKETMALKENLQRHLDKMLYGAWNISIREPQSLKTSWYYAPRKRYRADRIIHDLNCGIKGDTVRIALVYEDISTSTHNQKDYGVMGLSYRPGHAAVISTHRLRESDDLWKVTLHEFLHTMGLPHCANDAPNCIMQDAHGKNTFYKKNDLCNDCKKI